MKMVILGAKAPENHSKPQNPTSASQIGTMNGANGKKGRGSLPSHQPTYQGLLQVPRIPGIFDHQVIRTNITQNQLMASEPDTSYGMHQVLSPTNQVFPSGPDIGKQPTLITQAGLFDSKSGRNAPMTSHVQQRKKIGEFGSKTGSKSTTSIGGHGTLAALRPGQKSIKQQRDLAQLRFYQTLTNQPNLITQQQVEKQTKLLPVPATRVKMLSNMRMAQKHPVQTEVSKTQEEIKKEAHIQNAVATLEKQRMFQSGQATLRPKSNQQTTTLPQTRIESQRQDHPAGSKELETTMYKQREDSQTMGRNITTQDPFATQPIENHTPNRTFHEGGKEGIDLVGSFLQPNPQQVIRMGSSIAQNLEHNRVETAQKLTDEGSLVKEKRATSQESIHPAIKGKDLSSLTQEGSFFTKPKGSPPSQKRRSQQHIGMISKDDYPQVDERAKMISSMNQHPISQNSKAKPLAIIKQQKSSGAINTHQPYPFNQQYSSGSRLNMVQRRSQGIHTDLLGKSNSPPHERRNTGVFSKDRDSKMSPLSRSKNMFGNKYDKLTNSQERGKATSNGIWADEDDQAKKVERFSSQGQEELVQAYQLPTVYAGYESKLGPNQHNQKRRTYTSYGVARGASQAREAMRQQGLKEEEMQKRAQSSGRQKHPSYYISSKPSQGSKSKGVLNNILVKTCNFNTREEEIAKREQIKTAYTITRAGRHGMGVLPKINGIARPQDNVEHYGTQDNNNYPGDLGAIDEPDKTQSVMSGGPGLATNGTINYKDGTMPGQQPPVKKKGAMTASSNENLKSDIAKKTMAPHQSNIVATSHTKIPVANPAPCERFLKRGNKPVPQQYEEQEIPSSEAMHAHISRAPAESQLIPTTSEVVSRKGNNQSATGVASGGGLSKKENSKGLIYNNLQIGQFQDQISGINLNKLFSVQGQSDASKKGLRESHQSGIDFKPTSEHAHESAKLDQPEIMSITKGDAGSHGEDEDNYKHKYGPPALAAVEAKRKEEEETTSDEDSEDEEEEPLIIQLMESMFTRKKTVQESRQMISQISVNEIRQEIRRLALREKVRVADDERSAIYEKRMAECEKLNRLIQHMNQEMMDSEFEKPDQSTRDNPFFQALIAQKNEREKYKQLLKLAIMQSQQVRPMAIEAPVEDGANDIFKHTFVDFLEEDKQPTSDEPRIQQQQQETSEEESLQQQIFVFYDLTFDLPPSYYKQLGDFTVANRDQIMMIKRFMNRQWQLLEGKRLDIKVGFDHDEGVFNVVLIGKRCPLSKCCKMPVNFQFSREIGGKVICMEQMCCRNPLGHFFIDVDLIRALFFEYPLESHSEVSTDILSKATFKRMKPGQGKKNFYANLRCMAEGKFYV